MTLEGKSKCSCHVERICPTWLSIFAMTLNCNRGVNVVHYPLAARVFCSQLLQRHDSIWFSFIHLQTMLLMFGKRCCSCLWSYDDPEVPQTYVYYYFCIVLHCILAKVLRNGTNLWHVFRLFVLKLTWSPLKIAGCFFFFGWLLWANRFRSPLHLTRPWRCIGCPETNLSSLKPWEAWVGNILSVLKNAKPGEQIEVPQDFFAALVFSKGSSRMFKWPGCVVCIQVW